MPGVFCFVFPSFFCIVRLVKVVVGEKKQMGFRLLLRIVGSSREEPAVLAPWSTRRGTFFVGKV